MSDLSALGAAVNLLSDVDSLLENHPASKDPKSGKPAGSEYGPLLRSGTALCYTAWEVYVEEALIETVEWLLENRQPQELPKAMRDWVAKESSDPWAFVGDLWRSEVLRLVRNRALPGNPRIRPSTGDSLAEQAQRCGTGGYFSPCSGAR